MKEKMFTYLNKQNVLYLIIVIAICVILIRIFVFEAFFVRGDSMSPAILPGDYVLVNKLAYVKNAPKRGDIVVVIPRVLPTKIVKRIIGLPGELFSIENEKIVIRNERGEVGTILDESYLTSSITPEIGTTKTAIDPNEFFVLGDNRNQSIDSRELGMVDSFDIRGKVFGVIRFNPLKYIGF